MCYCINDDANPPTIEKTIYGCPNDTNHVANAEQECKTLLEQETLSQSEFICLPSVMCPIVVDTPLEIQCDICGDSSVYSYHCQTDFADPISINYGCVDNVGLEMFLKEMCASALGKKPDDLTETNFFSHIETCPGGTTEGDTTGGDTTGGDTTGGDTTGGSSSTGGDSTTGNPLVDCGSWDPSSSISYTSGIYSVDTTLVTDLLEDPTPLLECDDLRLLQLEPGNFEVVYANAGELLYELGLRDGDIPLYLNGYPLETTTDAIIALGELWYIEAETDYDLVILRDGRPEVLSYSLY